MELFILVIGVLGFFGLLLMININRDDSRRLQRKVSELQFELRSLDIKLRSESIKNNLRAIEQRTRRFDGE